MFTCGPSVYQRSHIGNFRTFLYEDLFQRYLEYLGYHVNRVISLTDVEDKGIEEARNSGVTLKQLTDSMIRQFRKDGHLLHIKCPNCAIRASRTVSQAVFLTRKLLQKGYAYYYKDHIFYDPLKFHGFGKLFRLDMSKWPRKENTTPKTRIQVCTGILAILFFGVTASKAKMYVGILNLVEEGPLGIFKMRQS